MSEISSAPEAGEPGLPDPTIVESDREGGGWDGTCTVARCGFVSSGHATEQQAAERLAQHLAEHASGEPMRELADFQSQQADGSE